MKTVEEARYEFYDLFQTHHSVEQGFSPDRSVPYSEFLGYHKFISSTIENENAFQIFMTGVWNLDLVETNGSPSRVAGSAPQVYGKNSKEQWKYDMHRSLFGKLDNSPM